MNPDSGFSKSIGTIEEKWRPQITETWILADSSEQKLFLLSDSKIVKWYPISTASAGMGNFSGSNKTPLGAHLVRNKIGAGEPAETIFIARKSTQRTAVVYKDSTDRKKDYITSRILWLGGLEPGRNLFKEMDTYRRMIYIHGTPEEGLIGKPVSKGCIRMRNEDVIDLFDKCREGTFVFIQK